MRALARVAGAVLAPVLAAGCVADPPPPRVPGEAERGSATIGPGAVTVLLDGLGPGFNPHLRADMGADTDLLSSLTLPSAYVAQPDGSYRRNADLVTSVSALPGDGFVLRYRLADKAQWSDGVPIGVEDFRYLWQRLSEAPGTVGGARGYRHITAIRPGAGGKVIDVEFDQPYPRWRELFANLLPAHLMSSDADDFVNALAHATAASGGPYKIGRIDLGIGEIVLVRNDRYWAAPAAADQIVLQSAPDAVTLGQAARGEGGDLLLVADTDVNKLVVDTVGGYRTGTSRATAQLNLTWNVAAPGLGDPAVRRALSKLVDAGTVARIVTGETNPEVSRYPVGPPVDKPAAADVQAGRAELAALGFESVDGRWIRDGVPLEVTVGVEAGDEQTLLAAQTVADQLRRSGVGARAWELETHSLYSGALPYGLVQAAVTWSGTTGDPLTTATSRFTCDPGPRLDGAGADGSAPTEATPSTAAETPATTAAEAGAAPEAPRPTALPATVTELQPPPDVAKIMAEIAGQRPVSGTPTVTIPVPRGSNGAPTLPPARGGNLSGVCDPAIDAALDRASAAQLHQPGALPGPGDDGASTTPVSLSSGLPTDAVSLIQQAALEIPLAAPQHLAARGSRINGVTLNPDGLAEGTDPTDRDLFLDAREWRLR